MNIIFNLIISSYIFLFILNQYYIIQSQHYEINRFLIYIKNNYKVYIKDFIFISIGYFLTNICPLAIIYFYILLAILLYKIKILKFTPRVKRFSVILILFLFIINIFNLVKYLTLMVFPFMFLLHFISNIIENIIMKKFVIMARKKIKNKHVIGVSGSFGKTSCKNIIYDLLNNNINVSKSPKSYNNCVGICKSINEYVSDLDECFICEYGVDRVKGMDKLLKVVKPEIVLITYIGNQHLLTFKNKENILKEKIKLIMNNECLKYGIINNDNKELREYDYKNKTIIRYGIEFESDVMAKNIVNNDFYSEFDLYIKNKYINRVRVDLLGEHVVSNVLGCIGVCVAYGMDIDIILNNIKYIRQVSHRLEYKVIDEIKVIDDSYNSNINGFILALKALKRFKEYKIIITPGIIEQGENNKKISYEIAIHLKGLDYICLVGENSKYIASYLNELNILNYTIFDSFNSAYCYCKKIEKEKIILIENDLPDIYLN